VAVGSRAVVAGVQRQLGDRGRYRQIETVGDVHHLREAGVRLGVPGFAIVKRMGNARGALQPDEPLPMKVVGRRRWRGGLPAAAGLLELALKLRGDKPFVPRGVYRFTSFDESDEWSLRMLTRPRKHGHRS